MKRVVKSTPNGVTKSHMHIPILFQFAAASGVALISKNPSVNCTSTNNRTNMENDQLVLFGVRKNAAYTKTPPLMIAGTIV